MVKEFMMKISLASLIIPVVLAFSFAVAGPCMAASDVGIVIEKVQVSEPGKILQCKYCGKQITPGHVHIDAENIIREKLQKTLTDRGIGYYNGKDKGTYISVLIYRFQERKGGNFAVEKPAGAGFHMHIMQGTVVGRTFVFDEDQQALSENLLGMGKFIRRGAKWITVEELAEEGVIKGTDYLLEVLK
jgi:hypothetical protein